MKFILSFLFLFSTYSIYGNSDTILIKESDKIIKIENKIKILNEIKTIKGSNWGALKLKLIIIS